MIPILIRILIPMELSEVMPMELGTVLDTVLVCSCAVWRQCSFMYAMEGTI